MSQPFPDHLSRQLQHRKELNAYRTLRKAASVDFTSNDFLGLSRNQELLNAIKLEINKQDVLGSGGSRLLSGNNEHVENLERYLADVFQAGSATLFNSGYTANLALLSSIGGRNDVIMLDEKCHASIKDGARLSMAKKLSFAHNNPEDLERKLLGIGSRAHSTFVVVESLYSMDGDFTPLSEMVEVCNRMGAYLIVDEAHSTGVYGGGSCSWVIQQGLEDEIFARVHTFGKALGVSGSCIVGHQELKDFFVNFARPFIYTTAPNHLTLIAIRQAFQYLIKHPELTTTLNQRIQYFKTKIRTESNSAIQPVTISGNDKVKTLSAILNEHNLDVRPILSPTVPKGEERLRVCIHNFNTEEEMDALVDLITTNITRL